MRKNFPDIAADYHDCFLPLSDVYQLGGITVFHHLSRKVEGERNLLVVPLSLTDRLEESSRDNSLAGAVEVLEYLSTLRSFPARRANNLLVREVAPGLDILLIENKKIQEDNLNNGALSEAIKEVWRNSESRTVKVITNSPTGILRNDLRGIRTETPQFLQVNSDIVHEGIIDGTEELYAALLQDPRGVPSDIALPYLKRDELHINQFVRFRRTRGFAYAVVEGRLYRGAEAKIVNVENPHLRLLSPQEEDKKLRVGGFGMDTVLGISPKDMEQYLAMQYGLLNPDVTLFFLCGSQGSGKTLLSYVSAVDQVLWYNSAQRKLRMPGSSEKDKGGLYQQIVLLKPNDILGGKSREVGFLPGSLYDKLRPHLGPYIDAHKESSLRTLFPFEDMLRHPRFGNEIFSEPRLKVSSETKINNHAHLPADCEVVQMTYSGHMRGRSFRDTLILLDEAQNFTPYEVKTILERMGPGCKAVVMGDPKQVDNPFCTREINGLTHAIAHFIAEPFSSLVNLSHHYRSQVSEVAGQWQVYSASS